MKKTLFVISFVALFCLGSFVSFTYADTIEDFLASLTEKNLGLRIEGNVAFEKDLYVGENVGIGTANPTEKLTVDGMIETSQGVKFADGSSFSSALPKYMILEQQKTGGSNGGTFTKGAWRKRVLNTVVYNSIEEASLDSNEFTLPAGTYRIKFSAPAYSVNSHRARLANLTDVTYPIYGSSEFASKQSRSYGEGVITIETAKIFALQHRCEQTDTKDGLGVASGFGTEVYSQVFIEKLD